MVGGPEASPTWAPLSQPGSPCDPISFIHKTVITSASQGGWEPN